jgi:hypothetical protein
LSCSPLEPCINLLIDNSGQENLPPTTIEHSPSAEFGEAFVEASQSIITSSVNTFVIKERVNAIKETKNSAHQKILD